MDWGVFRWGVDGVGEVGVKNNKNRRKFCYSKHDFILTKFKIMNKYRLLTFLLCLSFSAIVSAQSNQTMGSVMPASTIDAVISDLTKELSLSSEQIEKLTNICTKHQEKQIQKAEAARSNPSGQGQITDRSQDELNREISTILTQQQRSQFNAVIKKYGPE